MAQSVHAAPSGGSTSLKKVQDKKNKSQNKQQMNGSARHVKCQPGDQPANRHNEEQQQKDCIRQKSHSSLLHGGVHAAGQIRFRNGWFYFTR
jgi:glucan-binding YG repeat protein